MLAAAPQLFKKLSYDPINDFEHITTLNFSAFALCVSGNSPFHSVADLVGHLKDRGIGVLITDHNVRETLDLIDRAYIIHDGMVMMEGKPEDIVGNEEVRRVYLGDRFSF